MSAPFNVFLKFTGICTLVPLEKDGVTKALMALLVDGRKAEWSDSKKDGLDGRDLSRHEGFLRFDGADLADCRDIRESTVGVWYPNGHRLRFELSGGVSKSFRFRAQDVKNVPKLEDVAPGFGKVDPMALKRVDPRTNVLAQVLVEQGEVVQDMLSRHTWGFSEALGGKVGRGELAHEVVVDMGTAKELKVLARNLSEEDEETLFTFARDSGTVELTIQNVCDTNPLGWRWKVPRARDDEDFRWHYELLENPDRIRDRLMVLGYRRWLPYPRPIPGTRKAPAAVAALATASAAAAARAAAMGENCYPALAAPSPYSAAV